MKRPHGFLVLAAVMGLASCAGASASIEQAGAGLEGIYRLESQTLNDATCDAEGASVLDGEAAGYLALYTNTALGEQFVQATACSGVDDCREKAGLSRAMGSYWTSFEMSFSEVDRSGALVGDEVSTGTASMSEEDPCHGTVSEHRLASESDSLRIEQRSTTIDAFPKEGGRCSTDAARAAAREASCSRLLVITAIRAEDLERRSQ